MISNCVLNLSPDKLRVWREIARSPSRRPGGGVGSRAAPPAPRVDSADLEALIGCVSGAPLIDDVRLFVQDAGLTEMELTQKPEYIDAMTGWQDPLYQKIAASLPAGSKMSDYVVSLDIRASKPVARARCCG